MHVPMNELCRLQQNTHNIRNICIMAHVDHGKTSLADCLLMSNGLVSQSAVGERRYLDSRPDEQQRGITMKSSSILLKYSMANQDYLVNLIDSPGHVDFSSEVSCAVRLCDGVIIVVDVVEGVCPQTQAVLYQAYIERMEMILYLNKVDRLINELAMDPIDAYHRMYNIVGQVNALLGSFHKKEMDCNNSNNNDDNNNGNDDNENDDGELDSTFDPIKGNVLIGSSIDGWAFGLNSFADILSQKFGASSSNILPRLWGDYYFDSKTKRFYKGAISKNKKPCFVQFILDNIWHVYNTFKQFNQNSDNVEKIYKFAGVELKSNIVIKEENYKQLTREFMQNWLPAYDAVLQAVVKHHPSPCSLSKKRITKLMSNDSCQYEDLPPQSKSLMDAFLKCSSDENAPVIVFVSKMILISSHDTTQSSSQPVLPSSRVNPTTNVDSQQLNNDDINHFNQLKLDDDDDTNTLEQPTTTDNVKTKLIAFARIFSGSLKTGKKLYVLMPKFKHSTNTDSTNSTTDNILTSCNEGFAAEITINELFILMGTHMETCNGVPSGNIVGIGGLDQVILKSATISSTLFCPTFSPMTFHVNPIVKVSIEPSNFRDLARLSTALETLALADSNLIYELEDSGESVLYVTGEVHLQRCITDLENLFHLSNFHVSTPIVPFKEASVVDSCIGKDSTTQILVENYFANLPTFISEQFEGCKEFDQNSNCPISSTNSIQIEDPETKFRITMRCLSIPDEIQKWIESIQNQSQLSSQNTTTVDALKTSLRTVIGTLARKKHQRLWLSLCDRVWFVGTKNAPINLLVDSLDVPADNIYFHQLEKNLCTNSNRINFLTSGLVGVIYSGFCMAINSGPLMEEPMSGTCFVIEDITIDEKYSPELLYQTNFDINTNGRLMSIVKQCCRCSYLASGSVRLSLPMYETTIYLSSNVMGKAYAVLGRREAKIIREEILPETNLFTIVAQMPVIESFGFSAEILTKCRGLAQPQVSFSHWEVLDVDPFWVPGTDDEIELHGKAETITQLYNVAMKYIRSVRKRKGLSTDEKTVECAEKQRTHKKNK